MTYPRKSLISIKETPHYHWIARCVRRAWLWGVDDYAGKDYSHRKEWVMTRLRELRVLFVVDICAYAVLSNHYHLVLYVDSVRACAWSDAQVIRRWKKLFGLPTLLPPAPSIRVDASGVPMIIFFRVYASAYTIIS